MPPPAPPLLRQLLRPQQCRRDRSPRSFDTSQLLPHLRLLLLLLLLLVNRQQQLAQQHAPIRQPPHWFRSQSLTRSHQHTQVPQKRQHAPVKPPSRRTSRGNSPAIPSAAVRFVTSSDITPIFITPLITKPPTPSCGCAEVLSHPADYHTPFVAPASCTLSPGLHKIPHPPQDTTPVSFLV